MSGAQAKQEKEIRQAVAMVRKRFANGVSPGKFGPGDDGDAQLAALTSIYATFENALTNSRIAISDHLNSLMLSDPIGNRAQADYMYSLTSQIIDLVSIQRHVDLERIGMTEDDMVDYMRQGDEQFRDAAQTLELTATETLYDMLTDDEPAESE